ncbi:hypothetical protein Goari_013240, partial [Gossypium aridum]|nr:hypothetical protein [Gossypium aridum]
MCFERTNGVVFNRTERRTAQRRTDGMVKDLISPEVVLVLDLRIYRSRTRGVRTGVARVLPSAVVSRASLLFYPFCLPLFTSYTLQHTGWVHDPTSSSPTRNKLSKQLIFNHLQTSNP